MAKSSRGSQLFVLLVIVVLAIQFGPSLLPRSPVQVKLQVNGQETYVAETWQEWTIQYENKETAVISSDNMLVSLEVSPKTFGENSYVKVKIPIRWKGGLSSPYFAGVVTSSKIFIGQTSNLNYLGETTSAAQYLRDPDNPKDSIVFSEFWVGGSKAIANLKAQHAGTVGDCNPVLYFVMGYGLGYELLYELWHGRALLNIQPLLDKFAGQVSSFYLWIQASQKWTTHGYGGQITDSKTVYFELQAPFSITTPQTYTAPFTVTAGGTTSGGSVYLTVEIPAYTITRVATTYIGLYTTVTVEATTYSTATKVTLTAGQAPPLGLLGDFIAWLKKYFGEYWWAALICIIVIGIFLLKWLLGGGGSNVTIRGK